MAGSSVELEALVDWERQNADLVEVARTIAQRLLAPLPRRWNHVQGVARRAIELRKSVHCPEASHAEKSAAERILVGAAWLHDIGYSPEIKKSPLHAADGADYLRTHKFPEKIINLVAHHSGARFEAEERGLSHLLSEYPFKEDQFSDALTAADLTTSPDGAFVSYGDRIDEVLVRYPPSDPVHRFWLKARPIIGEEIRRTEQRIATYPR